MTASVHGVRDRVDSILTHLERVDDRARAAAHGVGDQFRLHGGEAPHGHDAESATGEVPVTAAAGGVVGGRGRGDPRTPASRPP